jgi:hypothetical protein
MIARDHEHMRSYLREIDTIRWDYKTDSMIELGCAKEIFLCNISYKVTETCFFLNK